jgi:hypothetical protein
MTGPETAPEHLKKRPPNAEKEAAPTLDFGTRRLHSIHPIRPASANDGADRRKEFGLTRTWSSQETNLAIRRNKTQNAVLTQGVAMADLRWTAAVTPRCMLLLFITLSLAACDLGGGGDESSGGGSATGSVVAAQVIELPPGKTQATLGWAESEGNVQNYAVYESRNGGDYVLAQTVSGTRATVSGKDGDAVRISVFAINRSGRPSKPSPPSPILRFHAADPVEEVAAAAAATVMRGSLVATTSSPLTSPAQSEPQSASQSEPESAAQDADETENPSETSETSTTLLADSILRRFAISGARFPLAGLSESAQSWMQARIDEQFTAGVRLVGTGQSDADGLRELIWQDPAGQLFVSTGRSIVDAETAADIPATFTDGIRLRATERFIARGDFTNDTAVEWVVEDMSTGDVLVIDALTLESTNARSAFEGIDWLLVGHGDFDGDERQEFLWQQPDGQLRIGHPSRALATLQGTIPSSSDSLMLTVADFDADGSDDIVSVDATGRLEWTLVRSDTPAARFEWQAGPSATTDALELIVTLDDDHDGRAELVFLGGEILETWDAGSGPL